MPRVRMLSTQRGSEDGIRLETHEAGVVYDLAERLAGIYTRAGFAVDVDMPAAPTQPPAPAPVAVEPPPVKPRKNAAQNGPKRRKASAKGKGAKS